VYIRDSDNSRLWLLQYSPIPPEEVKIKPKIHGYYDCPDFINAVDTGRIVNKNANNLFLPVEDTRQRIAVVLYGELSPALQECDPYEKRLRLRAIWNLAQKLQPAIANAKIKLEARKGRDLLQSNRYRSIDFLRAKSDTNRGKAQDLLETLNCKSIIFLERGLEKWFVAIDKVYYSKKEDVPEVISLFEGSNTAKLDQIASFPSHNGLLLETQKLHDAFPRISSQWDKAVFLMPTKSTSLIGFVLEKEIARRFDGLLKERLEQVGRLAAA
jgi:hypothetical protein